MSLVNKLKNKQPINNKPKVENVELSHRELDFLLTKLRSAQYNGDEFEMFYTLWTKLAKHAQK